MYPSLVLVGTATHSPNFARFSLIFGPGSASVVSLPPFLAHSLERSPLNGRPS